MKVNIELDQSDLDIIHDVVYNALDKDLTTNEEILEYWNMLPEDIKLQAVQWGVDDAPTRDEMYVWYQKNCTK